MGGQGSGFSREKRLVNQQLGRNKSQEVIPAGESFHVPNHSGDHSAGRVDSTPIEELDLVNKEYVDSIATRDVIDLFLTNNASDIANYKDLEIDVITATEETITQAITANSTTLIASFASILNESEIDEIRLLESGIYDYHAHIETNFGQGMTAFWEFYHRTATGAETLLGTSHDSPILTSTETEYDLHISITSETAFVAGDRIVAKVFGRNIGNATKNITISMEGDTASRFEFPGFISPGRFLLKDGSNADTTIDIGSENFQTTGRVQIRGTTETAHPLFIKSKSISGRTTAIALEEISGTEGWHIGVEPDGSLAFTNSFTTTPDITFKDSGALHIDKLDEASTRETLLQATIQDASRDFFAIANSTGVDGVFAPLFIGAQETTSTSYGVLFTGSTNVSNDTGTRPLVGFVGRLYPNNDDYLNPSGSFSAVSTRPIAGFGTSGALDIITFEADGEIRINLDSIPITFGASQDVTIKFDGSDMIINSENVTANDELLFTNFTAYDFDNNILARESVYIVEKATANADTAGQGQLWVKNDDPNVLMFTDDAGTDFEVGGTTAGSRQSFTFNDGIGISADDYLFVDSDVQMSATRGFRMHRAGSIIGHSISCDLTTASSGDMTFEV